MSPRAAGIAAEVLQTVPIDQTDLFATAPGGIEPKSQAAARDLQPGSNGHARHRRPEEGGDHG